VLVKLEGIEDTKTLFILQGRLRQLRDLENLPKALEFHIQQFEKQEQLDKLKEN
jgi:hypothetical protein